MRRRERERERKKEKEKEGKGERRKGKEGNVIIISPQHTCLIRSLIPYKPFFLS